MKWRVVTQDGIEVLSAEVSNQDIMAWMAKGPNAVHCESGAIIPWHQVRRLTPVSDLTPEPDSQFATLEPMPYEEWREFHTAATGRDPGPEET